MELRSSLVSAALGYPILPGPIRVTPYFFSALSVVSYYGRVQRLMAQDGEATTRWSGIKKELKTLLSGRDK